jgi:conjugative relaxase-like TrwC/TraI family protein
MNKSAGGAKKYYCEEYYKEGQSAQLTYYSEQEQLIGKWGGKAAAALGLVGDIAKQDFAALCDNQNPFTKQQLTSRHDADRTVGYDFTFNASKSVSLAYALGNEGDKKVILKAFQAAVHDTMLEVETGMQARVRAKGKNENRMTGNIAYGAFTHFTTRPIDGIPDPHLHSHCFVFNATHDHEDKKWKAGQFQQVKQDAPYYEAVFHSKLAQHLQNEGYAVERTKNGFELSGVGKTTLDRFSRRTKEIEDYAQEHHITDDKQKSQVGAKTREAKRTPIATDKQEAAWLSRVTDKELADIRQLKQPHTAKDSSQHLAEEAASKALQASLDHHLERKSVASDKEILATAIKSSVGVATPEQVKVAFQKDTNIYTASEKLRTFVTTKAALQEEKQLIRLCNASKNKFRPINDTYEPQNLQLNEQQRAAVRHALSSTDGITIITGKAGTGKTTLMREVKQGILASGKQIYAFAPSSEASRGVQRSEGFENADTVARLVLDSNLHPNLKNQVIWIDEAGMLSNKDMNHVLAIANAQSARVILSGDTKQHTSIERGDALRIIQQEAGIKPVTVDKIQRQKNAAYKEAVQLLSGNETAKGFKKLDQIGAIHEITDGQERVNTIADEYYHSAYANGTKPTKAVLVIAPTHAEGEAVTRQIRQTLKEKQVIGQEDQTFTVLKNRQLTEIEKQDPNNYQKGDMVAFHQNSKGIKAGKKLEVMGAETGWLSAKDTDGQAHNISLSEAKKFTVFEPREIEVTEGDAVRITANGKSNEGKHLFNGSTYHIKGFDKDGNINLSNGSAIPLTFGHFNLGYVSTSHASQGKTADKVIVSQSSATFRASSMEQFYVSVSRGREAVSIYTDDKAHLEQAVSQSSQRVSATELIAKRQEQQVQAMQRTARLSQQRETAVETHNHLTPKTRTDGLQTTTRTD